jgi:hypothetical protein
MATGTNARADVRVTRMRIAACVVHTLAEMIEWADRWAKSRPPAADPAPAVR